MKSFVLFFLILLALTEASFSSCGTYHIKALVVMKDGFASLVINPGTKSEITLKVEFNESAKLSPYINRLIETTARLQGPMDETRGLISSLGPIEALASDPLSPSKGTKFEARCH